MGNRRTITDAILIPLTPTNTETTMAITRLAAARPPAPPSAAPAAPPPPTPDDARKIQAIAAVVGTDPNDIVATATAVDALFGQYTEAEVEARRQLTASELRAVKATPGGSALGLLAAKRAFGNRR